MTKDASGPNKYHVPENENNGEETEWLLLEVFWITDLSQGTDTLHGGDVGYDRRAWSTLLQTKNEVTFGLVDPDGDQGFPGTVLTAVRYSSKDRRKSGFTMMQVTYKLAENATWKISIDAIATAETPIMLSGHHYWNLDAYQDSEDLVDHVAQFNASQVIATDGQLIPNGSLIDVAGTPLDFRVAKSIGDSINATAPFEYCGTDCVGFDNCWVYDNNTTKDPSFSIWSIKSGIK